MLLPPKAMSPCWAAAKWQENKRAKTGARRASFLKRNLQSIRIQAEMRPGNRSDAAKFCTTHHNFRKRAQANGVVKNCQEKPCPLNAGAFRQSENPEGHQKSRDWRFFHGAADASPACQRVILNPPGR